MYRGVGTTNKSSKAPWKRSLLALVTGNTLTYVQLSHPASSLSSEKKLTFLAKYPITSESLKPVIGNHSCIHVPAYAGSRVCAHTHTHTIPSVHPSLGSENVKFVLVLISVLIPSSCLGLTSVLLISSQHSPGTLTHAPSFPFICCFTKISYFLTVPSAVSIPIL